MKTNYAPSLPVSKTELLTAVERELAYRNVTDYKRLIYRRYQHAPHLQALDTALMQVTRYVETQGRQGIGRLVVEMPPRHGKSLTNSRLFPTWHLGRNPDHRFMLVSYGADLAEKHSRVARNIVASPAYQRAFPGVTLAQDSKSVASWDIEGREGGMDALGIGAGATGKGAHVLNIDDPIKNREQAESEVMRQKIWDGYTDDLYTRLEPGGAVIITMTRWHEDDMVGRALSKTGEHWTRLRLPALAEPNDPLGRSEGAALWPDRYPLSVLNSIRETLGPYGWASLYEQNPRPREGATFKRSWFQIVDVAPSQLKSVARYWDKAGTSGGSGAATAGVLMGIGTDGLIYVLHVVTGHWSAGERERVIRQTAELDAARFGSQSRVRIYVEQEPGSGGKESAEATIRNLSGFVAYADRPTGDKDTRLDPLAAQAEAGNLRLVRGDWNAGYIDEMTSIPYGARRDQGDASSGAYNMLVGRDGRLAFGEMPSELADYFGGFGRG